MFGDKLAFICNNTKVDEDSYGHEKREYSNPQKEFRFNYMPSTSRLDYQVYGEKIKYLQTSILDIRYSKLIHRFDKAYLLDENVTSENELRRLVELDKDNVNKPNANYKVISISIQNARVKVVFEMINNKED